MHLLLAALIALSSGQTARIDSIVAYVMRQAHIQGLSIGVARNGTPLYVRGYGFADVTRSRPADGYTIYRIGSLTKQFTAALVMQEVERERVSLDAPIRQYLPQIEAPAASVTIAQLLGQTSGVVSDPPGALAFKSGTQWQYSNANYQILGSVLQAVTGVSYPALLAQRIVAPLGLRSTGCDVPPFARNVAHGYVWAHDAPAEMNPGRDRIDLLSSAGAMVSNVPDLLTWLEKLRAGRVVAQSLFVRMSRSGKLDDGTLTNYGFGFFVNDWEGRRTVFHSGYIDGFSSADALVPDDGLEVVLLANQESTDLVPLAKSVVTIADSPRGGSHDAILSRPPQNESPAITADVTTIARAAGLASLGSLLAVEFIGRRNENGVTYDTYRVTYATGAWKCTIGYRAPEAIVSLTMLPYG